MFQSYVYQKRIISDRVGLVREKYRCWKTCNSLLTQAKGITDANLRTYVCLNCSFILKKKYLLMKFYFEINKTQIIILHCK